MKEKERLKVFDKYGGKCAYCGCELDSKWQVDHAISKVYWFFHNQSDPNRVNDFENLMPACYPCNHYKRSLCISSIHEHTGFRHYMSGFHKRLAKIPKVSARSQTIRRQRYMQVIADKYGITVGKPFSGLFYFETFNNPQTPTP